MIEIIAHLQVCGRGWGVEAVLGEALIGVTCRGPSANANVNNIPLLSSIVRISYLKTPSNDSR